jgi:large subunit ribosomal protein L10
VLADFGKENEGFSVKAGYVEGSILGGKEIGRIAALPSKGVLVAQAIGIVQGPMRGIVTTVNAVMSSLVVAIEEVRKKKEASSAS